mmetsp:Transcript_4988/g.8504  ORF Transcript_4988/g.8504 Transcript_4988/m.8504 type:complete len:88 (+) Transcript_4988:1012-1275(+)
MNSINEAIRHKVKEKQEVKETADQSLFFKSYAGNGIGKLKEQEEMARVPAYNTQRKGLGGVEEELKDDQIHEGTLSKSEMVGNPSKP